MTCASPAPVVPLGPVTKVSASVTDATSGPVVATVSSAVIPTTVGSFTVPIAGVDRAGNKTMKNCPYQVVRPPCFDNVPTIVGTSGNDTINGTAGRDVIKGLGGIDKINGLGGNDVICGDEGPDTIDGGPGNDTVDGGAGDDSLLGAAGDDNLNGGLNNDSIRGDGGRDTCTSGEIRMSSCEVVL